jgi:hypothetical protein
VIHAQKKTKLVLLRNIVRTVKKSYAQNVRCLWKTGSNCFDYCCLLVCAKNDIMMNGSPYIREVITTNPQKPPAVICHTDEQLKLMKNAIVNGCIIGWGLIIFPTFSDCGFLLSCSAPVWSTYMFGIAMNICIGRVATYIFDNCNWQLRGHMLIL